MLGLITTLPEEWSADVEIGAPPDEVLRALTTPEAIAAWAPVPFEIEGLAGERLRAGSRERVSGSIAGVRASFAVEVVSADARRLELIAEGPVDLHVAYRFTPRACGVLVTATVRMRRRGGITASLLRTAVAALLNGGALAAALRRLRSSVLVAQPGDVVLAAA